MPLPIEDVQTERLTLTALSFAHSAGMYQLWSHPDVARYSGEVTDYDRTKIPMPASAPTESDKIIDFWQRAAADGWGFRWAIIERASSTFVGHIGFNSLGTVSEIAYHLKPDHWGKGIMSEAGRAAIDWALTTNPETILKAFIEPANAGSVALITRLGFTATGIFEEGAECYRLP
jgi:RimJ/RimL family protein N-acetyltransferase